MCKHRNVDEPLTSKRKDIWKSKINEHFTNLMLMETRKQIADFFNQLVKKA